MGILSPVHKSYHLKVPSRHDCVYADFDSSKQCSHAHSLQHAYSRDLELGLLKGHAGRYIPIVEKASDFLDLLFVPYTWQRCVPPGITAHSLSMSQVLTPETRALGVRTGRSP